MRLKEIKPGMVIHCKTEIEAWYLLEYLSKLGFVWLSSRNLLDDTNYRTHGNETCYEFVRDSEKRIAFGSYEFYEDNKRDIVEFSSLIIEEKTYEDGLNEAWDFIRKIYDLKCDDIEKIFNTNGGVYGVISSTIPIKDMIAKLEAYEAENQIKVGDVVTSARGGFLGVVTMIVGNNVYILWDDGSSGIRNKKEVSKTGKNIDISSVLSEIGKE